MVTYADDLQAAYGSSQRFLSQAHGLVNELAGPDRADLSPEAVIRKVAEVKILNAQIVALIPSRTIMLAYKGEQRPDDAPES